MNCSMTDTTPARNVRVDAFVAQMHASQRAEFVRAIERENMAELKRADISARIRQAREEAGLTQNEMADALDVGWRTYQNYESATKPRTPWSQMDAIASITGKTSEWLIHGATPNLMDAASAEQIDDVDEKFTGLVQQIFDRDDEHRARMYERLDRLTVMVEALLAAHGVSVPDGDVGRTDRTIEDSLGALAEMARESETTPPAPGAQPPRADRRSRVQRSAER